LQNQSPQQLALQGAQPQQQQEAAGALQEGEDDLAEVTSPMVGTFYRSSSPGADAYVSVGSVVEPDTVVCIVEAMKVMNEIKAGVSGEIVEILVEDAEPVEFGQVLFLVEPHEE
jgi:acetyl-CoA carboxylase biotin carboxyl carrier protein